MELKATSLALDDIDAHKVALVEVQRRLTRGRSYGRLYAKTFRQRQRQRQRRRRQAESARATTSESDGHTGRRHTLAVEHGQTSVVEQHLVDRDEVGVVRAIVRERLVARHAADHHHVAGVLWRAVLASVLDSALARERTADQERNQQ